MRLIKERKSFVKKKKKLLSFASSWYQIYAYMHIYAYLFSYYALKIRYKFTRIKLIFIV